jgi:predicted neutral ceramidase superfamily lipid hydrolase
MSKHLDRSTQITLAVTLVLFVVALFEKGFTHDLLLEAAVFLVSAKLVLLAYKASVNNDVLSGQLTEMSRSLTRIEQSLERSPSSES